MRAYTLLSLFVAELAAADRTILVTGATGRSGSLIYSQLKQQQGVEVRALTTSFDEARSVLNCSKCDSSEGIFVGDVTNTSSLMPAVAGVDSIAIAVGLSSENATKELMEAVEWKGVENQVSALVTANKQTAMNNLHVALISSMGTSNPNPPPFEGGKVLFYKLQAEAFLASSGVSYTIVKPCGLLDKEGGKSELVVGHDDGFSPLVMMNAIPRADVASIIVAALMEKSTGLRFDLCTKKMGTPTMDYQKLLKDAKWQWQH